MVKEFDVADALPATLVAVTRPAYRVRRVGGLEHVSRRRCARDVHPGAQPLIGRKSPPRST